MAPRTDKGPNTGETESINTATVNKAMFTPHVAQESTGQDKTSQEEAAGLSSKMLGSINDPGTHNLGTI